MSTTTNLMLTNKATLRFTAGYAALTSINFSIVASAPTPLYRLYQETLGLTPLEITLIFAIYSLTMVATFLAVAQLSDFVGRKPMILAALVLNALALVLFIEANTSTVLMVARAVQGVSTGVVPCARLRLHALAGHIPMGRVLDLNEGKIATQVIPQVDKFGRYLVLALVVLNCDYHRAGTPAGGCVRLSRKVCQISQSKQIGRPSALRLGSASTGTTKLAPRRTNAFTSSATDSRARRTSSPAATATSSTTLPEIWIRRPWSGDRAISDPPGSAKP
jgi:hypothetical protein|nr:MFS transporter [Acidisoma sp. PAMC 29798]